MVQGSGRGDRVLVVEDLHVQYGGIKALQGVTLDVGSGEIVAIIGANGAGKSTTLRVISGLVRPSQGSISFMGQDLLAVPNFRRVEIGVVQVPEGRRIFDNLTVQENLDVAAYTRKTKKETDSDLEYVFKLFPRLTERRAQQAGMLSGGEQQMLAIGRALMAHAKLLMLDEPSMGLSPILVRGIFRALKEINERGTTVLLVEQNARMALKIAHRAYVLQTGSIVLSGSAAELAANPEVQKAYLGG